MKKKKLLLVVLASCLLTGCGKTIPTLENGQEAMVTFKDGTKISVDDVWKDVKASYALNIVMDKIDMKILKEEYPDKIEDMEKYIKSTEAMLKASYVDDNGNYDENTLLQTLSMYGYSGLDDYLNQSRITYLQDYATDDYAKSLVTEKEIKNYYDKKLVGDISAVHILVKPASDSEADQTAAKEKAEKIIKDIKADIKAGTNALDAFKKYEKDTTVTYQDLGTFNKGDMVESFEKAVFALKKNEYTTTPIKTEYGFHVALKTDEKEKKSLTDATDEIKEKIAAEKKTSVKTISTDAMLALRDKYGVSIIDSEINNKYNLYINYLLNK